MVANARAVYRLNTYPFIHLNFFHALMNILALVPLLERFESEHGTLTSLALFFGREFSRSPWLAEWRKLTFDTAFVTIPSFMYLFVEKVILRANTAVMGAR